MECSTTQTDSTNDFLTDRRWLPIRIVITTLFLLLIATLFWFVSQPKHKAVLGKIVAVDGKCSYSRICIFTVTTENAKLNVVAMPIQLGDQAIVEHSNREGLQFCVGNNCNRASIDWMDEDTRRKLGIKR